jgi:hypothetical protein
MNLRTWMLIGAVLAVPALGWTDEPGSRSAAAVSMKSAAGKPALDLRSPDVQKIIRAVAQQQVESVAPDASVYLLDQPSVTALGQQTSIPFRAPRRVDHTKCGSFNCVAYTADGVALFTIPRDQYYGQKGGNLADEWLSCQSRNDLLTTFERYDQCRGISIGIPPVGFGNVMLDLPMLHL